MRGDRNVAPVQGDRYAVGGGPEKLLASGRRAEGVHPQLAPHTGEEELTALPGAALPGTCNKLALSQLALAVAPFYGAVGRDPPRGRQAQALHFRDLWRFLLQVTKGVRRIQRPFGLPILGRLERAQASSSAAWWPWEIGVGLGSKDPSTFLVFKDGTARGGGACAGRNSVYKRGN